MSEHEIVGHDEWIEARTGLLAKEKEFTRLRDELSRQRRELPWERVETEYVFDGPQGKQTLAELFEGRSQLVVYHFMFGAEDDLGCKSCSFWADNFDPNVVHLNARDVTFVAVSRAPFAKLAAYKGRMGWSFKRSPRPRPSSTSTTASRSRRPTRRAWSTTTEARAPASRNGRG